MLKEVVTYKDYDGTERTEDVYFHMTKRELIKWETESGSGGMDKFIERIVREEDRKTLINMFDDLILRAYGEKSDDGKAFIKTPEMRSKFENSACYDQLFYELLTSTEKLTNFVNGLIPEGMPTPDKPVPLANA